MVLRLCASNEPLSREVCRTRGVRYASHHGMNAHSRLLAHARHLSSSSTTSAADGRELLPNQPSSHDCCAVRAVEAGIQSVHAVWLLRAFAMCLLLLTSRSKSNTAELDRVCSAGGPGRAAMQLGSRPKVCDTPWARLPRLRWAAGCVGSGCELDVLRACAACARPAGAAAKGGREVLGETGECQQAYYGCWLLAGRASERLL